MKNVLTLLLVFGLITPLYPQSNKKDKKLTKEIDNYLSQHFKTNEPGCAVLIAKKGEIIYSKGIGLANLEWETPIKTNTVFQIGSVTKLFTAIGILQLVEQRKISLQDSIRNFIPDFPSKGHTITIEHLLTHSSGITEYWSLEHPDPFALRRDFIPIELINFFKEEPLEFEPGTRSSYTNSGYFLLGYIIEVVSGIPYGQYIEDNIFKPSEMRNSYYGDNSKIIPNRASSYRKEENTYRNGDYRSMSVAYAAGALLSTAEDLFKWHQSLYSNKLLKKGFLKKSLTAYQFKDGIISDFGYGGWFVNSVQVQESPTFAHSGGISGFNSLIMYLPKEDVVTIVLSNFQDARIQEITTNVATLTIGKTIANVRIDDEVLETYKGKYEQASNKLRFALIRELEGRLIIDVPNEWKAELSSTSQTLFKINNVKPSATLEFIKDDTGKVIKFVVNQDGLYEWIKVE